MINIKNNVIGSELVEWRKIKWFQNNNLKELSKESMQKLKQSFVENNFIQPFQVWKKNNSEWYFLDGHHREKAMKELLESGFNGEQVAIPDKLPANIIKCKNENEAAKLVLVYS